MVTAAESAEAATLARVECTTSLAAKKVKSFAARKAETKRCRARWVHQRLEGLEWKVSQAVAEAVRDTERTIMADVAVVCATEALQIAKATENAAIAIAKMAEGKPQQCSLRVETDLKILDVSMDSPQTPPPTLMRGFSHLMAPAPTEETDRTLGGLILRRTHSTIQAGSRINARLPPTPTASEAAHSRTWTQSAPTRGVNRTARRVQAAAGNLPEFSANEPHVRTLSNLSDDTKFVRVHTSLAALPLDVVTRIYSPGARQQRELKEHTYDTLVRTRSALEQRLLFVAVKLRRPSIEARRDIPAAEKAAKAASMALKHAAKTRPTQSSRRTTSKKRPTPLKVAFGIAKICS